MGFLKKMCFLRNKVIVLEIVILKKWAIVIYSSQQMSAQPIKMFDNLECTYFAYLIYETNGVF